MEWTAFSIRKWKSLFAISVFAVVVEAAHNLRSRRRWNTNWLNWTQADAALLLWSGVLPFSGTGTWTEAAAAGDQRKALELKKRIGTERKFSWFLIFLWSL